MLLFALSEVSSEMCPYSSSWVKTYLLCSPPTENCERGLCDSCKNSKNFDVRIPLSSFSNDNKIKYLWWETSSNGRVHRAAFEEDLASVLKKFKDLLPSFQMHHLIKCHQSVSYEIQKKYVMNNDSVCIIHFDFSENYPVVTRMVLKAHTGVRLK